MINEELSVSTKKEKEDKKGGDTTIGHRRRGFAQLIFKKYMV